MMYATTRVLCQFGTGLAKATGFYYGIDFGNGNQGLFLVTNKHVVHGSDAIMLEFHESHADYSRGPTGNVLTCQLARPRSLIVDHPDEDVDLCFVNLAPISRQLEPQGKHIYQALLSRDNIPDERAWSALDAIEQVIMIGCPMGMYDEVNHMPIARQGVTASHPSFNHEGSKGFLVDIACFEGSSGSPVFLNGTTPRFDRETQEFQYGQVRFSLLGVLSDVQKFVQTAEVTLTKGLLPGLDQDLTVPIQLETLMNIGHVIKSSAILEIEEFIRALPVGP